MLLVVPIFCGGLNWLVDRLAYRHLRESTKLAPLVSAIGVSFIFMNVGLLWGGVPMKVFGLGRAAAAPKAFPELVSNANLLGQSPVEFTGKDVMVFVVTLPLMALLTWFVKRTREGKAMRAVAQDRLAAQLMGIPVDRVIGQTFLIGGGLAGVASVVFSVYNNTIYFQMGYRAGIDAFTAAVLGRDWKFARCRAGRIGYRFGPRVLRPISGDALDKRARVRRIDSRARVPPVGVARFAREGESVMAARRTIPFHWSFLIVAALIPLIELLIPGDHHIGALLRPIFIMAMLGLGLNILTGFTGLLNLGVAAFMAVGAYSYAILTCDIYPFRLGFWSATIITVLVGLDGRSLPWPAHDPPCAAIIWPS